MQNLGLQVEINKNSQFKDINDREFEYYDVVAVNAVSTKVTYKTSILALLMCVHFMKRSPFWILHFEKFHISDVCLSGGQNIRRGSAKKVAHRTSSLLFFCQFKEFPNLIWRERDPRCASTSAGMTTCEISGGEREETAGGKQSFSVKLIQGAFELAV